MNFLRKVWKDPVGSKLISALFIALISSFTWFNWQDISAFIIQLPDLLSTTTQIPNWIILVIILIFAVILRIVFGGRKQPTIIKEIKQSSSQLSILPTRELSPEQDLQNRVKGAKKEIIVFGLTRNYYTTYKMRTLLEEKSRDVPIRLYLMDPSSKSRKDRFRIEPLPAVKEDSSQYEREIAGPFRELLSRTDRSPAGSNLPGLSIYYYNFPISFAIEMIDDVCRVQLYGHGKRGSDSPILIFDRNSTHYDYFASQLEWIEELASGRIPPEWYEKKIKIKPFE
jgi:hypothetical protein